ncbi:hypothetical protein G7Y89_g12724 [Cudoniella acicularis]|uniref:Uncharacterized protein n=1 Tax=Cudoniella acicularis TaxID=354080 RepID=A0A8H4RBA5_9HELO|nr:hypothetical protein G7Y89_g12724 [Cudoniella acicularis]
MSDPLPQHESGPPPKTMSPAEEIAHSAQESMAESSNQHENNQASKMMSPAEEIADQAHQSISEPLPQHVSNQLLRMISSAGEIVHQAHQSISEPANHHENNQLSKTMSPAEEIAQLHTQLVEAVRREAGLQALFQLALKTLANDDRCYFLNLIPIEVRNMIYELLLVNPALSRAEILMFWGKAMGPREVPFELSTSIMRTCHQIHKESEAILYGKNTFIIDFAVATYVQSPVLRNPIAWTRNNPFCGYEQEAYYPIQKNAAVKKVRKWSIVVASRRDPSLQRLRVVLFARAISDNPPRQLQLLLHSPQPLSGHEECRVAFKQMLQPLKILRNVNFEVARLKHSQMPANQQQEGAKISSKTLTAIKKELKVVKKESSVQPVFRMCERLVAYAQSFERHEQFRSEMAPSYFDIMSKREYRDMNRSSRPPRRTYANGSSTNKAPNPFTTKPQHPVEAGIHLAIKHSSDLKSIGFLEARRKALEYLEPQYQRIAEAASKLTAFIKAHKIENHLFDSNSKEPFETHQGRLHRGQQTLFDKHFVEAMVLLEDYAAAFTRDVPHGTRINIRQVQRTFDHCYANKHREVLLRRLNDMLEDEPNQEPFDAERRRKIALFTESFRHAVDDMDEQYLQIREARKRLFEFGADENVGYSIDLELSRCDEKINWNVNEPEMFPNYLPSRWERGQKVENLKSLLNRRGGAMRDEFNYILGSVQRLLKELDKMVLKYRSLATLEKRTWDQMRFGLKELNTIRQKLTYHTAQMELFLRSLTVGALGRIESLLKDFILERLERDLSENGVAFKDIDRHRDDIVVYLALLTTDSETQSHDSIVLSKSTSAGEIPGPTLNNQVPEDLLEENEMGVRSKTQKAIPSKSNDSSTKGLEPSDNDTDRVTPVVTPAQLLKDNGFDIDCNISELPKALKWTARAGNFDVMQILSRKPQV